jgi:uracil-DNA glycosylase family 4
MSLDEFLREYLKYVRFSVDYEKNAKNSDLAEAMLSCSSCQLKTAFNSRVFPGTGWIDAKLFFVGESPSPNRKTFDNFSEKSREVVDVVLRALGESRSSVWLTNAVKCSTPGLAPKILASYYSQCSKKWLKSEIEIIKPEKIIAFGTTASKALNLIGVRNYISLPHPMSVYYGMISLSDYVKEVRKAILFSSKRGLLKWL